ncbi:MAG: polyhydroxyalkanoic acid system family protein [Patescibacteria group bacterium]|nr:polyhydroxyalkanoic acid system family protein [Patescibacteria group bacterium]
MDVSHQLGLEEALRRLRDKLDSVRDQFGGQVTDFRETWGENELAFGFSAVGMKITGKVAVEPSRVRIDAELPFAAAMFKGLIEQRIRDELGVVLA